MPRQRLGETGPLFLFFLIPDWIKKGNITETNAREHHWDECTGRNLSNGSKGAVSSNKGNMGISPSFSFS